MEQPEIIVIFDTDCVLCSKWVRFLLRHERSGKLHFASMHKSVGLTLATQHNIASERLDMTYLVVKNGVALMKSDASLALLAELKAPWRWLRVLGFVPRKLRDGLYDCVARNRLSWFGEEKDCFLPTPDQRSRFLDDSPTHS